MNKHPEIFMRRFQEEFVDEETGEKVLIDREQLDYTFYSPELLPTLTKHIASAKSDDAVEIYFLTSDTILTPRIDVENAESVFAQRLIIKVYNEDNRIQEVFDTLQAQYPETKWYHHKYFEPSCCPAIFNYKV